MTQLDMHSVLHVNSLGQDVKVRSWQYQLCRRDGEDWKTLEGFVQE